MVKVCAPLCEKTTVFLFFAPPNFFAFFCFLLGQTNKLAVKKSIEFAPLRIFFDSFLFFFRHLSERYYLSHLSSLSLFSLFSAFGVLGFERRRKRSAGGRLSVLFVSLFHGGRFLARERPPPSPPPRKHAPPYLSLVSVEEDFGDKK